MTVAADRIIATRHRRIRCSCGGFLCEGDWPLGHSDLRIELPPCSCCRQFPILFLDCAARFVVLLYPIRRRVGDVERPGGGWQ